MRVPDPYGAFDFVVEIDGAQVGGFSEIGGLEAELEMEDFREGGINDYTHRLAKFARYPALALRRGITDRTELWEWHQDVIAGRIERRTIAVILRDSLQKEVWRWVFRDAYPVKWSGSELSATANTVFVESVEFAHHGMTASQ